jgi:hypothetical protein
MKGKLMFTWNRPREKTGLENARDEALSELSSFTADTEEYMKVVTRVETLTKLIDLEKSEKLSPNTIAIIIGNAIIALVVVAYESKNVVTTKVLPFLNKTKTNS